ncbi:hypothetical protein CSUB01_00513 [Colletotrichum sublineola]|uniref:Uncharacterized protein n=1 Tax=Colletotrichum sublineola TaxID=1173701 RepID=A0A066WUP8_COLSU|nr:hypothetical protein CSUB01_00513 [Colletotrichum sublineola]
MKRRNIHKSANYKWPYKILKGIRGLPWSGHLTEVHRDRWAAVDAEINGVHGATFFPPNQPGFDWSNIFKPIRKILTVARLILFTYVLHFAPLLPSPPLEVGSSDLDLQADALEAEPPSNCDSFRSSLSLVFEFSPHPPRTRLPHGPVREVNQRLSAAAAAAAVDELDQFPSARPT